jgi:hypothetical protein
MNLSGNSALLLREDPTSQRDRVYRDKFQESEGNIQAEMA